MPFCAQFSAGDGQYLKMFSFSRQVFSIILTPGFQDWHNIQLHGIFRGPLQHAKSDSWHFSSPLWDHLILSTKREEGLPHFKQNQIIISFSTATEL